jgi:hypothetical protein
MYVILPLIAIYQLITRKLSGWWLALVVATFLLAIDTPIQVIRISMTDSATWDYSQE